MSLLSFVCMRWHDITDIGRGCGTSDYGLECAQLQGPLTREDNMSGRLIVTSKEYRLSQLKDPRLRVSVRCMCLI